MRRLMLFLPTITEKLFSHNIKPYELQKWPRPFMAQIKQSQNSPLVGIFEFGTNTFLRMGYG